MKLLFYVIAIIFICGALAQQRYESNEKNARCSASRICPLKIKYKNSTLDEDELRKDKYHQCCSSEGFCGETIKYCGEGCKFGACLNTNLYKRYSCSSLRAEGRCNSDCPCKNSNDCCSEYGFCGNSSFHCSKKKTSTKKTSTKKKTTTIKYPSSSERVKTTSSPGVIIYIPSYRFDKEINIETYNFDGIDVLNYCFYQIKDSGEAYPGNRELDIEKKLMKYATHDLKKKYPDLKVILTIGGTEGSKNFNVFLKHSSTREKAAKSIVKVVKEYNFDGLDVDWEFPENESESLYLLYFIKKIREYMGYDRILTISASALISRYYGHTMDMEKYLNWFNLMTYHYAGYWNKYSGYNSPLYAPSSDLNKQKNCDYTVESYLKEGVPRKKLILGVPYMGQAWEVKSSSNKGYNQRGDANIRGEPSNRNNEGFWSYNSLRKEGILSSKKSTSNSWVRTWHSDVKSPTLFNKYSYIYISYDDVDSMCYRSHYVKDKGIGGIMVWEAGQDYKRELLKALLDCYYD
ncbi:hypothetical protein BCR32DRAFT_295229 [Anaeromyces robustus]|uniref:Uncharacterized protein n=1 Tax=Anaeromyces robustus TaxID=1754192 RepID=A0A1Y1WXH8_9FUNG|nr:hypothetical protein BCR32DRAFT_295229 [Anaeromyces robustus]|eukprot:ORX78095.1 hypothetical protein BCR32DRAFT_295229 [Anaeromyces robustus]